jgi:hypothetical protein
MSDEGQRAQKTTEEFDQMVAGHQPDRSELDEAIAWRDRFIAWQTDRMRDNACTEEQIEAMVRKVLDMPYAFWIHAMSRGPGHLARGPFKQPGKFRAAGHTAHLFWSRWRDRSVRREPAREEFGGRVDDVVEVPGGARVVEHVSGTFVLKQYAVIAACTIASRNRRTVPIDATSSCVPC